MKLRRRDIIDEAELESLYTGPCHHDAVIGAELPDDQVWYRVSRGGLQQIFIDVSRLELTWEALQVKHRARRIPSVGTL